MITIKIDTTSVSSDGVTNDSCTVAVIVDKVTYCVRVRDIPDMSNMINRLLNAAAEADMKAHEVFSKMCRECKK